VLEDLEPLPPDRPRAQSGETSSPGATAAPRATGTLAELYLRQGHTEEAAEIYRRMLADDPGNPVAHAGLSELTGSKSSAERRLELYRSYAARLAVLREVRDARA